MKRLIALGVACALALGIPGIAGCAARTASGSAGAPAAAGSAGAATGASWHNTDLGCGWEPTGALDLAYARQFTVDRYQGGLSLICCANGERFLVVPQGAEAPQDLAEDIAVIQQPLDNVYLVSTGMICLLDEIDALDAVTVASVSAEDSPNENLARTIEAGDVAYGGRYRDPDFELIADTGCTLAIENTQIDRYPEAKQKLQDLGVTVFTEQSSTEDTVLGRLEWIRLMGVLFDREEEADEAFERIARNVERTSSQDATGKTVAFFYIDEDGSAVVRRSGDYFAQMIELAGGEPISFDPDETADGSSTTYITVEMEEFFARAKDADIIIYNATVDDSVTSIADLVAKNKLLGEFKAVQTGEVYSCDSTMYQQMTSTDRIIEDLHAAFTGGDPTEFVWRVG